MSKNPFINAALALGLLAVAIFFIGLVSPETYAEWKELTFHEPAHFLFEWQNEIFVIAFVAPVWQRAKAKAVRQAIDRHDAQFHPHSHRVDSTDDSVVR